MKIKKISFINNLGGFSDFKGDEISDFKEYNFIYGWNYSGKTTFSRLFRFLEIKSIPDDFKELRFKIETDSGEITQGDIGKEYPIRVFNEDFVAENFYWDDENHEINPVFILGKEAKELEEKMKKLSKDNEEKSNQIEELKKDIKQKENSLANSLTNKASEIRRILGITNSREFDKNSLEEKIKTLEENYESKILDETTLHETIKRYKSEVKREISFNKPKLKFNELLDKAKKILSSKVTSQQLIQRLQENPELSKWIYEGIRFHENETTCQFCGNKLPEDLLDRLNKHFSDEYKKLKEEIKNINNEIDSEVEKIKNMQLPHLEEFFKNFHNEYDRIKRNFNDANAVCISNLKKLKKYLSEKENNPFEQLEIPIDDIKESKMEEIISELDKLVSDHNEEVKNFQKQKKKLQGEIIEHYAAEFINQKIYSELKYFELKREIENKQKEQENLANKLEGNKKQIKEIQNRIKAEAIGAERINEYFSKFFSENNLKVELTDNNNKYKLYRDNKVAKYLSTGEKNIIALIYFFAKLDETNFDFRNSIIFIDDPISSLDSNHLYGMNGFICEKFKSCGQLFITTHNYDFFNLLKDFKKYDLRSNDYRRADGSNPQGALYLIKKTQQGISIQNLPPVLERHKSEYNYLFSILHEFKENSNKSNFEMLFILPNIIRRFLEQYLNMKYPDGKTRSKDIKDKFKKFADSIDEAKISKVLKLINEHSHEEVLEHSKRIPELLEIEDCISFIMELLNNKDSQHLEALKASLR
ncbi:MAG: AAA family ATPase [Minisyncoccia bacterium]